MWEQRHTFLFSLTRPDKGQNCSGSCGIFYEFNRSEFLQKYHKRSNAESTFSMIKAKFGASVRSKTPIAQMNEVLCKIICHNLCVLVQSIYELGIAPTFWATEKSIS